MRTIKKFAFLTLITLTQSSLVLADATEGLQFYQEELKVVTASKKEETVNEAPGIMTIVTADEIRRYGARNLEDILERLPDVYPLGAHFYRDNIAATRGDVSQPLDLHTLILIDGRPYESSDSSRHNLIYDAFPVDSIDHIEMIRGPGSVLYGSGAYTDVINIITKVAKSKTEFQASEGWGSFNGNRIAANMATKQEDFKMQLGAQYYHDTGWPFAANDEKIGAVHPSRFDEAPYGQKEMGLNFNSSYKNFRLSGFYAHEDDTIMGTLPIWPGGPARYDHFMWNAGYTQPLTERWDASLDFTNNRDYQYLYNSNPTGPSIAFSNTQSFDYRTELTVRGRPMDDLNIVVGGTSDYQTGPANPTTPQNIDTVPSYSQNWWTGYSQVDYKPLKKLKLITGAQLDAPAGLKSQVVPRVGAIYSFNDNWGAKALYGEAYRSPSAVELDINNPGAIKGNPALSPERVSTTDLNLFYNTEHSQSGLTAFYSKQTDLIVRVPYQGNESTFANAAALTVRGVELETKLSPIKNLQLTGSYTFQENRDGNDVLNTTLMPNTMVKTGLSYDWNRGVTASIFNSFYSKRFDDVILNPNRLAVNPNASPYNWLTANLALHMNKLLNVQRPYEVDLSLYGINLLNEAVYDPEIDFKQINTIPAEPGRSFLATMSIHY